MLEEVKAWQSRPLEEIYPILYLDALVIKVRDGHQVRNRAAHLAVGVDLDGIKHVLGIWVQASEGAKFWAGVCAELRNRGIRDVLIVCCDGLTGFPEAIEATWPQTMVQTCTVHLIRAAMRFVSYQDRKRVAAALRPIYTAPTVEAAETELLAFAESDLGKRYPATVATWDQRLGAVHPISGLPPGAEKDHLHHQQHREPELPAPEDHQESGALPHRRRGDQAAVAGHPRHRGQTRPPASQGEGPAADPAHRPRPAGRRRHRAGLESRPRRPRPGLPRPARRPPHLTPFLRHGHPFPPRGGVHVERPQRSEDERRGHRQAVEDDQQRRKIPPTDRFTYTDILTSSAGYLLGAAWVAAMIASFNIWRQKEGLPRTHPDEGLEPEHANRLR